LQPGAGAAAALDTPLPLRIIVQETGRSVISSLSTSRNSRTNAHTASASQYTQVNEDDVDLSDSSDEKDTLSPKKAIPDFTVQKSDDRGGNDKNLRKIICQKINFEVWKL
jgi:hypothetical protein